MKKGILLLVGLVILLAPFSYAVTTEINVETLPVHDVTIVLLEPISKYQLIKGYPAIYSKSEGAVNVTYDGDSSKFHIRVIVKDRGQVVLNELFESKLAGGTINLEVFPDDYVKPEEAEEVPEEEAEEETQEDNSEEIDESQELSAEEEGSTSITGQVVDDLDTGQRDSSFDWVYYLIGVVVLGALIAMVVFRRMVSTKPPHQGGEKIPEEKPEKKSINPFKKNADQKPADNQEIKQESQPVSQQNEQPHPQSGKIEEVERKIRDAQRELESLKNEKRIEEMEKKLEQDKRELDRLRGAGKE